MLKLTEVVRLTAYLDLTMSQDGQTVTAEWLQFGVFKYLNPFADRPLCLKRAESKHTLQAYVFKNPKKRET